MSDLDDLAKAANALKRPSVAPIDEHDETAEGGGGFKEAFKKGDKLARITSRRQALIRGVFNGSLIAFLIWGPMTWWIRLLLCLVAMLVCGALVGWFRGLSKWI